MRAREYPELPLVGVGGVVISGGRVLLIRRGSEPALGEWTVPGGVLESGETLRQGVEREVLEETGMVVRALELIEVVERIFYGAEGSSAEHQETLPSRLASIVTGQEARSAGRRQAPQYHYVILDYLCAALEGEPALSSEISDFALIREEEMGQYPLTEATTRVLHKAFAMARGKKFP